MPPIDPLDEDAAADRATKRDLNALIDLLPYLPKSAETALRLAGRRRRVVLDELAELQDEMEPILARLRATPVCAQLELALPQPQIDVRGLEQVLSRYSPDQRLSFEQLDALFKPFGLAVEPRDQETCRIEWATVYDKDRGLDEYRAAVVLQVIWCLFSENAAVLAANQSLPSRYASVCSQLAELDGVLLEAPRSSW